MAVMNVKRSTTAFSKAEQTSSLKSETANTAGAEQFQKAYGDQAVGDVLNKVANPNWVDPSKQMRATGNNQLDKDAFLKLMLAQMKHQDPTNPTPSHEMAAQLAQFTSLEQLNNINSTLGDMKNAQSPGANFQALAFIGKKVSGDSSRILRGAGDTKHAFNFELLGDAAKVDVTIKDAGGNVVRKLELANLKKGQNSTDWNGLNAEGMPMRPGEYKIVVEGKSSTGAKVWAKTSFEGRITGLNYSAEGPILMVGNQSVRMSDVRKIEEAGPDVPTNAIPLKSGALGAAPGAAASAGALGALGNTAPVSATMPSADQVAQGMQQALQGMMQGQADAQKAQATPQLASAAPQATDVAPALVGPTVAPTVPPAVAKAEIPDEEIPPAPEEDAAAAGNIEDVPMSRELLNQLAKAK